MDQIDQSQKTLVFCQTKTSTDPNYCQRVTANDGALGEQHLEGAFEPSHGRDALAEALSNLLARHRKTLTRHETCSIITAHLCVAAIGGR